MTPSSCRTRSVWITLAVLLALGFPSSAAAYIDPGSGSFFVQMLLAGLLGLGMTLKMYWRRIKSFFRGRDASGPDEPDSR